MCNRSGRVDVEQAQFVNRLCDACARLQMASFCQGPRQTLTKKPGRTRNQDIHWSSV
jgi:hypothetical protein